jgi:hypothetical protein
MSTVARQSLLLAVLVAVLAAVVVYQMRGPEPAAAPLSSSNPAAGAQDGGAARGEVTDVRLELLTTDASAFRAPRRDPFQFRTNTPPPVVERAPVAPPVNRTPPPPPPPARPPISASIRLLGIYDVSGRRVAVLHDGTKNPPIHGVQGDVIEGRYRLLRVDQSAVELAYLDGGSPQRIPLPGQ